MRATGDVAEVVQHAELLLMVIPTQFVAATLEPWKDKFRPGQVGVLASGSSEH